MKKLIFLVFLSSIFFSCKNIDSQKDKDDPIKTAECIKSKDMSKYYDDTQEMVKDGKNKTALKRFIWFHENALKYEPDISGVRLSFALSHWKRFADDYPPAMKALKEIRDRDTKKALENGNPKLFKDVSSINRELEEDSKTVTLFVNLAHKYPSLSKKYWVCVNETLFDNKRYDLISLYIGSPINEYYILKNNLEHAIDGAEGDEDLNKFLRRDFAERCTKLIQYCQAVNDLASAKEIQKKALTIVNEDCLIEVIPNKES